MSAWAAREPAARHEIVPGAGHLVNQDAPGLFNDTLLAYLDDL